MFKNSQLELKCTGGNSLSLLLLSDIVDKAGYQ